MFHEDPDPDPGSALIKMDPDPSQIFGLGANVFFYIFHLGFGSGDLHMFTDPDELTKYIFV